MSKMLNKNFNIHIKYDAEDDTILANVDGLIYKGYEVYDSLSFATEVKNLLEIALEENKNA